MSTIPEQPDQPRIDQGVARDAAYWAKLAPTLKVGEVPAEALNDGRPGAAGTSSTAGRGPSRLRRPRWQGPQARGSTSLEDATD